MPNWCHNRVEIYSDNPEDLKQIKSIFETERPLHQITPEPDWATIPLAEEDSTKYGNKEGEIGELPVPPDPDEKWSTPRFKSTGRADERWYDWNINNWGTKWDAYNTYIEDYGSSVSMSFQTAWAPPVEVAQELRRRFNSIDIKWMYNQEEDPHYQWQDLMNEI